MWGTAQEVQQRQKMLNFIVKHIRDFQDSFLPLKQLTCQLFQSQYPTKKRHPFLDSVNDMASNWAAEEGLQQNHPLACLR